MIGKKLLNIIIFFMFCLHVFSQTETSSLSDIFILTNSGSSLLAFSQKNDQFYSIKDNIYDISMSSNGTIIYKDKINNIYHGRLQYNNNSLNITDETKVAPELINSKNRVTISNDGKMIVSYNEGHISTFKIIDGDIEKKAKIIIKGSIARPSISYDNSKVVFYNRANPSDGYTITCLDIEKNTYNVLGKDKFYPISISGAWTITPSWNKTGEYITYEGKYSKNKESVISIIRLKDQKVIPSPSYLWADSKNLACFDYQQNKFSFSCISVDPLFDGKIATRQFLHNLPILDFQGLNIITSMNDNSVYVFQDAHNFFYYYNSATNSLEKLCQLKNTATGIFILKKNDIQKRKTE